MQTQYITPELHEKLLRRRRLNNEIDGQQGQYALRQSESPAPMSSRIRERIRTRAVRPIWLDYSSLSFSRCPSAASSQGLQAEETLSNIDATTIGSDEPPWAMDHTGEPDAHIAALYARIQALEDEVERHRVDSSRLRRIIERYALKEREMLRQLGSYLTAQHTEEAKKTAAGRIYVLNDGDNEEDLDLHGNVDLEIEYESLDISRYMSCSTAGEINEQCLNSTLGCGSDQPSCRDAAPQQGSFNNCCGEEDLCEDKYVVPLKGLELALTHMKGKNSAGSGGADDPGDHGLSASAGTGESGDQPLSPDSVSTCADSWLKQTSCCSTSTSSFGEAPQDLWLPLELQVRPLAGELATATAGCPLGGGGSCASQRGCRKQVAQQMPNTAQDFILLLPSFSPYVSVAKKYSLTAR